jgi:hypothetical protein
MGERHVARVDVAAVHAVAGEFATAADLLATAAHTHLSRLGFDGATAGHAHAARGEALRTALDRLSGELTEWSRAAAEIAMALRAGADRYADAENRAAVRVG